MPFSYTLCAFVLCVLAASCAQTRITNRPTCIVADARTEATIENRIRHGLIHYSTGEAPSDAALLRDSGSRSLSAIPHDGSIDTGYYSETRCVGYNSDYSTTTWGLCRARKSGGPRWDPSFGRGPSTFSIVTTLYLTEVVVDSGRAWVLTIVSTFDDGPPALYHIDKESMQCYIERPEPEGIDEFVRSQRAVESILTEEGLSYAPDWVSIDLFEVEVCEKDLMRLIGGIPGSLAE